MIYSNTIFQADKHRKKTASLNKPRTFRGEESFIEFSVKREFIVNISGLPSVGIVYVCVVCFVFSEPLRPQLCVLFISGRNTTTDIEPNCSRVCNTRLTVR